jgi:hypothetical protein
MSFTINPNNHNIQLTRGDSFSFTLNENGVAKVFGAQDKVYLTARLKVDDTEALISKEFTPDGNGNILIEVVPSDTKDLAVCTAFYDIQWTTGDGDIYTIIPTSGNTANVPTFQICQEVTRPVVEVPA